MTTSFEWPPPFTLRHSARARSVGIKICPRRGLQLVVPRFFDPAQAPFVLQQHRKWIERTWQRIKPQVEVLPEADNSPQQLSLLALNETWIIQYVPEKHKGQPWLELAAEKRLIVYARDSHYRKVKKILLLWLRQYAQLQLLPWLATLSQQTGLCYVHANVRHATTRWGSCSVRKTISLNCRLLFLPGNLVEYVLVHELCHTIQFNHSRQFWDLVKQFNPECHQWRKQLKQANHYIPIWLEE